MMKIYRQCWPYGVAIGSTAIALLLTLWLKPLLSLIISPLFYIAIIVSAWYGGFRPGFVSIVLSTVALAYFFLPPLNDLRVERPEELLQLGCFFVVALAIALLADNFQESKKKVERLSQQLLQENAEQLRMALAAAQMGMWDWNLVTGEIKWSPEHEQLFGLTAGTFDGKYETFEACLHPEDREQVNQALERSLRERVPYQHEFRIIWADGSIHWIEGRGQVFFERTGQPARMTGTVMAIDDRKQAQATLQEREAILRLFAQYAPAGIAMLDRDMRYLMASQRWVDDRYLDSVESLIARSHYEIFPEIPEEWRQIHQRCLAGAIEKCDDDLFVNSDGREQWTSWEIRPWYTVTGEIGGIVIFTVDVTQRKQTQKALQQSEQRYRALVHASSQIVWRADVEGSVIAVPHGWEELTGQSAKECLGWGWLNVVHPEDRELSAQCWQEAYTNSSLYETEYRLRMKDGHYRDFAVRGVPILDADGKISEWIGTCTDITERKQAEAALKENQIQLQRQLAEIETIYQSAPIGLNVLDSELRFVRINQRLAEINGLSVEAHIGHTIRELLPDLADTAEQLLRPILETGEPLIDVEITGQTPAQPGVQRIWLESFFPLKDGNRIIGLSTVCEEITKRKQAEVERIRLLEQEQAARVQVEALFQQLSIERSRLEQVLQQMPVGVSIAEAPSGKLLFHNAEAERLLGHSLLSSETYEGYRQYGAIRANGEPYNPEEYPIARAILNGEVVKAEEMLYRRGDGRITLFAVSAAPILDREGQVIAAVSTFEDIFERKQAALRLQTLFNTSLDGIVILDGQGNVLDANPRFSERLGYTREETAKLNVADWEVNYINEELQQIVNGTIKAKAGAFETCHRRKDGSIFDVEISYSIVEWQGEILRFCTCRDISERKQAELALQQLNDELEERVRARTAELTEVNDRLLVALLEKEHAYQLLKEQAQLLDLAHDAIFTCDLNSVITFWNQGAESMYGWSKAEAFGQVSHDLLKTQFPQPLAEIQAKLLEKGYWEGELIHFTWDDRPVALASRWALQKDDAGRPIKILEINNDITARKQAELALQQYNREVEDLYNHAPCGYHSLNAEGTIVRINDTELQWLGYTRDEVLNQKKFVEFLTPESQQIFYQNFPRFKERGWLENLELKMLCKDGSLRWVNVNASAIKDEAGNFVMSRTTLFDISDRKRLEAEREQAEVALRESEEQRRLALDLTRIGFWDWDIFTGKLVWNDNHFAVLGLVPGENEPSYQLWRQHLHPEDRDRIEELFVHCLEAGIDYEAEYRVVHPDGSVRWLMGRGKGIYDELGQPVRSLGVLLDISDRKRAEEVLRQYERIVSNTKDGIALMNRHYIYQMANEGYLSWCNKSESEVLGNSVRNILGHELFDNFIKPRLDRCLAGEIIQYERWFEYPNLVPQFLSVTYTPYRDAGDNISGVIVSLRDLTRLKQAEQILELQAVIVRNMAEGICLVRADNGFIVHANPKFEQMFGYDSGELNGQHVSIVNYASESVTAEEVNQSIRTAVLQNEEFSYEVYNVKKDGTPFWCSATCSVFKHPDYGDVLVAVQQDITERKRAEELLQQQAKQEQLLFSITQAIRQSLELEVILDTAVAEVRQTLQVDRVAIYRFNPDWSGDFIVESVTADWVKLALPDVKKIWEDTYLQETQGASFRNRESFAVADIYTAGLQPCHVELLEQFQAKAYAIAPIFAGEALWGLLAIYQNAAPRRWQSWEIELLEQIASQLAIAIQQSELYGQLQVELHERKQTEAILRETERRWRYLLDNVQLIVVGLDREGAVNYVNPCFLKLTGYAESEVLGQNWFEKFLPRSEGQEIKIVFSEVLASNAHPYYQNEIVLKSGERRFIAWNNTFLKDSEGKTIGTVSIGEDITERQKIEKMKNEFIGIVSHELRTPLTAIRASLGLLQTGIYDKKPDKFKRMIEIALIDSDRLVRLVNDILDLERLESGRAVLEKATCKAADLVQQAVQGVQAIADRQHITLCIHPTDVEVWAAADAIVQTLTNLLSNALKFSPADSTIALSVQRQGERALFQVSDRGRGIPADKLETIFGRFQQVDASDSRDKGGTGLGLAICHTIIEQHGGRIWAESSLGEGSTFFFTLPLSRLVQTGAEK